MRFLARWGEGGGVVFTGLEDCGWDEYSQLIEVG